MDPVLKETKRRRIRTKREDLLRSGRLIVKGFLLNVAHPGVLLFWLGVLLFWLSIVGGISAHTELSQSYKLALYGTTVALVFATDLTKAFLASRIRGFLTYNVMLWLNRVMGVVLVVFGAILALRAII
jgi:threonine/homoserine/homoserine lactone efflux protein